MENTSPRTPDLPPRPASAPTAHLAIGSDAVPHGWRDEWESDPEYRKILARMEMPRWKRPVVLWSGVVAVAVASFFLGGAVLGSGGGSGTSSPDPWVQGQGDQSQNDQQQNNQPVGLTPAQKSQILTKYCKQQAGGPYNVSEAGLLECLQSYEVTDQGMVMPK
ncbi:hypothetical protein [Streptomyces naganishii]|uniref:Uncharacterized protein n=1 Tax=Streptomyces naganishii JCM 4654 TaxID=1306179 RepID=A0A918Y9X9_9ACTN|nr:hypothetical protein [Streptomyces naganishii]GHD95775.1 hypothetical protein GCM10010508_61830 [Streptomyces naganishii JCM 4654]